MSDKPKYSTGKFALPPQQKALTRQESMIEHVISDDQLKSLEGHNQNPSFSIFLLSVGGALGAAAPALQEINILINDGDRDFTIISLAECIIFFGCGIGAAVSYLIYRTASVGTKSIFSEIRDRTQHVFSDGDG
ncbi:MAG: hypothetical protein ACU0DW_02515 [Shimia sp.]